MKKSLVVLVGAGVLVAAALYMSQTGKLQVADTPLPEKAEPLPESLKAGDYNSFNGEITVKNEFWTRFMAGRAPAPRATAEEVAKAVGASIVAGSEMTGSYLFRWPEAQDLAARARKINEMTEGLSVSMWPSLYQGEKPVPAPPECLAASIDVRVKGQSLRLAPLSRVRLDMEVIRAAALPDVRETPDATLCRITDAGKKPVDLSYISYFPMPSAEAPQTVVVFGKGDYPDLSYSTAAPQNYDSTYADYQKKKAEKTGEMREEKGHPALLSTPVGDGGILDLIWVAADKALKAPDGQPLAASCRGGAKVPKEFFYIDQLECWVTYPVNDSLSVKYKILTSLDDLPKRAKMVDSHVKGLLEDWLSAPQEP